MSVSRRGFLGLFAGAIAASATNGFALIPAVEPKPEETLPEAKRLKARHWWQHNLCDDDFVHRVDVLIGNYQYGVDFRSRSKTPDVERELEPALMMLANHIEREHGSRFDFEIRSFALDQVHSGESSRWFGRMGEVA